MGGGGGYGWFQTKISCRLISNEKKSENFTWGNVPALKKNIYMLKKILKRLYVGEKILSPEVWEKKFLPKPYHPTPLCHRLKSQIVGPKGSNLSVLVPRTRSHQNPVRTWAMVKRFPTIPSHAEVKCLFYDEHSSRQEGGSKCCRWRCGERSSSTRFIELFASLKVGTSYNFFNKNMSSKARVILRQQNSQIQSNS